MASAKKILTLDLGTSTLKLGEFTVGPSGVLTLTRFGVADLGLDPNKDEDRARFITATLTKLIKDTGVTTRVTQLSISGHLVFTRFVKLPNVEPSQLEQMIGFEAKQHVAFPIEEVVWDYQMMPTRLSGELEAIIVAIKKDVVDAEVNAVEAAGLRVKHVDFAPLSQLNTFRYNYPEVEESSLIIDMGARMTNLIFVEKNYFWVRSVPIAGNQISQNICNELQEPFIASETLKKGKGFVSLGGIYADPDDIDAARISKLIRSTMTRLHIDINRSIAFWRTTMNGGAPKRIFLTGGSSQLPYLDLFIVEKLNIPVEYLNPIKNVNLANSLNIEKLRQDHCYTSEIVGLALRETGSCPSEIMLDAPVMTKRREKKRKEPYLYAALVAWIIFFVCLNLFFYQQIVLTEKATAQISNSKNQLAAIAPRIQKLTADQKLLKNELDTIQQLGKLRDTWPKILNALNSRLILGIWLVELKASYDPRLEVKKAPPGKQPPVPPNVPKPVEQDKNFVPVVNYLQITGYYHAFEKTQELLPDNVRSFVLSLADEPSFSVDKNKENETLTSCITPQNDPNALAQKFTMKLRLSEPIELNP